MILFLPGFLAGLVHVFSGPDHLAAVAPLAVKGHRHACFTGLQWGFGHALGVAVVGAGSLLLREMLPLDLISSWSERLVGVLLIGIGLWGLRRGLQNRVHTHEHEHGSERHVHIHVHSPEHRHEEAGAHVHKHAALGIGVLHGLAGSSHLLGVLPALALPTFAGAATYLVAYGVGTIAAMAMFSTLVGALAAHYAIGGQIAYRRLMTACSSAAILVGCAWLVF